MGCKNSSTRLWNYNVRHTVAIKHTNYLSAQESHSDMGADVAGT